MADDPVDPVLLGQRIVGILETGLRTATYKLATLMALIDQAIEHVPARESDLLTVPIPDLAERVLALYWPQVRPFEGRELRQSTQPRARIVRAARTLRAEAGIDAASGTSLPVAAVRAPDAFETAINEVTLCLAQQPLHRLQRLPGSGHSDSFLYDDDFLHGQISRRALRANGDAIVLRTGVAAGLARLSGLLKPALEIMWVDDVRRMNAFLAEDIPDVAGHLFGRERTALAPVREPLKQAFGARCFYCNARLAPNNPVDHVLPWSLLGIDGLANLVLSCAPCNADKCNALPSVPIIDHALERDRATLEAIAQEIQWPTQYHRVVAAARGVYLSRSIGSATWAGRGTSQPLDLSGSRWWLAFDPTNERAPRRLHDTGT